MGLVQKLVDFIFLAVVFLSSLKSANCLFKIIRIKLSLGLVE